ncbi:hypothetical protein LSH36_338g05013 [Paralvinella palmiformis]|uniref:Uncharacterized protein n=1 Tax=Paralvinella palmiformis TaxID=53620 RepID=A0AAD9JGC9_9ANNE|nr:hypothetical protein LSH36_338g05013 [Paralvinella palmiformis]
MGDNLAFSGIPEVKEENSDNIRKMINELFVHMGLEGEKIHVLRSHRIGIARHNPVRSRDIVAVFDMRASLTKDKLKIEGKVFTINDLDKLPEKVNMASKLDKVTYSSVEQYSQRTKALMIQDNSKAAEIILTRDPMIIKSIGDTIPTTQMWTDNQL